MNPTMRALALGAAWTAAVAAALGASAHSARAAYVAHVQNGTLQVSGDAASDKLAVGLTPTTVQVDVGVDGSVDFAFSRTTVNAVVVNGGAGDDEIRIALGSLPFDVPVTLNGGAGDDTLLGGPEADVLNGGAGNDLVDGNIGADQAQLGSGDDTFQWDPGDGSDVVDGQGGRDSLNFNGSNIGERIDLSANGPRLRLTRDVAAITMDTDGIEHVSIRTLSGADTVTVGDLTGTDVDSVLIDLAATGGVGDGTADTVVVNGTNRRDVVQVTRANQSASVAGLRTQTTIVGTETIDTLLV